jgi:hypothetical protein
MGAITVPIVYAIMRESGYPILIAAFSASLVLFGKTLQDSPSATFANAFRSQTMHTSRKVNLFCSMLP